MSRNKQPSPVDANSLSTGDFIHQKLMLEPERWALFLDIDGTLIDLAETPDGITVQADLAANLSLLSKRLNGALALVTGRAMPYADALFNPYSFPIAGLHGSERRDPSGKIERIEISPAFEALKADLAEEAREWPGVLIEDKGAAVAAHYRQSPERQESVEATMSRYLDRAGSDFKLQRGKMVVEIRPARAGKGHAVEAFMQQEPFKGRKPITIGDDVTDEEMFAIANQSGGVSIRISETPSKTIAQLSLPSAAHMRAIIAALAAASN